MGERDVPEAEHAQPHFAPLRSIQGGRHGAPRGAAASEGGPASPIRRAEPEEICLPALTSSARFARHWVMNQLASEGVYGLANQVIELLTGELVANAALHGPPEGLVRVRTWRVGYTIRVAVRDESPVEPVVRHPEPTAPNGRGLALVETLSAEWGIERHSGEGKTVWFSVDLDCG